jgi:methyltransferase family protein
MNGKLSPLFPLPAGNAVNTTSRRRRGHVIGLTALFTNGPRLKRGYFDALKDDTHGLMPGAVYSELYKLALAGKCDVIDVGVGRGATSIAFALGIQESGRASVVHAIDQFSQHSRGPHRYCRATNPHDCDALNLVEFRANVDKYGVSHLVRPRLGTTDAIAPKLSPDLRADLLSIDVDGMIDRDLAYFYDFVEPGGIIVLDDYSDFIDGPSASRAAHIRVQSEAEIRAWIDKDRAFNARRLLGKKLLTYRLANYFAFVGAMTFERTIGPHGTTAVFRKATDRPFSSFSLSGIPRIEQGIIEDFIADCRMARLRLPTSA